MYHCFNVVIFEISLFYYSFEIVDEYSQKFFEDRLFFLFFLIKAKTIKLIIAIIINPDRLIYKITLFEFLL